MNGWEPIETAPKTGAGRGMFGSEQRGPDLLLTDGLSLYLAFWNGHSWDDGDYYDHIEGLTHWMRLPALPDAFVEIPHQGTIGE